MVRRPALALGVVLLLIGCGESAESSLPVAGLTEIAGPYQTEPYRAFDQALVQKVEDTCAPMNDDQTLELVLADGRGGGRLLLVYNGANGASAECVATIESNGNVVGEGSGSSSGGQDVPGPLEIRPMSGGSSGGPGAWSYLHGQVGSEISRVVLELGDGTHITASLSDGRFAAWWPGEQREVRFLGYDASGTEVVNQPY